MGTLPEEGLENVANVGMLPVPMLSMFNWNWLLAIGNISTIPH